MSKDNISTEQVAKNHQKFKKEIKKKIWSMRPSLGFKVSTALGYILIEKHTSGKSIEEIAPQCQMYMKNKVSGYMPRSGKQFLNELEIDLEENAYSSNPVVPKEIFAGGNPISNLYDLYLQEILPEEAADK